MQKPTRQIECGDDAARAASSDLRARDACGANVACIPSQTGVVNERTLGHDIKCATAKLLADARDKLPSDLGLDDLRNSWHRRESLRQDQSYARA